MWEVVHKGLVTVIVSSSGNASLPKPRFLRPCLKAAQERESELAAKETTPAEALKSKRPTPTPTP